MKYRRKPVDVEAIHFLPELGVFPEGIVYGKGGFYMKLNDIKVKIKSGDWIVLSELTGSFEVVSDQLFKAQYEEAEVSNG